MSDRLEGPRFQVRTWREGRTWFARVVPVRPEAAPFTDKRDEDQATSTCPDEPRATCARAVSAAVAKWGRVWASDGVHK